MTRVASILVTCNCVYIQEPFNSPLIPRPQSISSDNDFNTFHPMSIQ